MEFAFDSEQKPLKHGVDFAEAQALWQDDKRVEVPARTADEPRLVIVGKIGTKIWAAIVTYREGKVRIISVRRARQREIELYEGRSV